MKRIGLSGKVWATPASGAAARVAPKASHANSLCMISISLRSLIGQRASELGVVVVRCRVVFQVHDDLIYGSTKAERGFIVGRDRQPAVITTTQPLTGCLDHMRNGARDF